MAEARVRSAAGNPQARLWVNAGKIYPAPVKVGRSYYVEESAVFREDHGRHHLKTLSGSRRRSDSPTASCLCPTRTRPKAVASPSRPVFQNANSCSSSRDIRLVTISLRRPTLIQHDGRSASGGHWYFYREGTAAIFRPIPGMVVR